ncbi:MAG: hypothetical protein KAR42_13535 [candidate division Zixibacteria bacterium]|nr:hypothetical protein [candidate division Zixibacteria bacterium]
MIVAFDIASFKLFRNGDLFYPGVASLLSIINCGGKAILFNSNGTTTNQEMKLIEKLAATFAGQIKYASDDREADMRIN